MAGDFLKRFPDWRCLQTEGNCLVLVKDMADKKGNLHAVGIDDDCVVVYEKSYDDDWSFFESDEIMVVPLQNHIDRECAKLLSLFHEKQVQEIKAVANYWQNYC